MKNKKTTLLLKLKPSQASKTLRLDLPCSKEEFDSMSYKERKEIIDKLFLAGSVQDYLEKIGLKWLIYSHKAVETYTKERAQDEL